MPTDSLKLFLTKLIDYAGLFPPANLNLIPALKNYRTYIECEDYWIMSQFIIPVNELENISDSEMEIFNNKFQLDLSILSGNLFNDIDKLKSFKSKYSNKIAFSGLESRIGKIAELQELLSSTIFTINNENLNLATFFELPYGDDWVENMQIAVKTISDFNKKNQSNFGFKLRCGGIKAEMFPEPPFVSNAIIHCIKNDVPMKFTAGLHHPIRHYNESVKTKMYGFINIFIGGMLAKKYNLSPSELTEILIDENENNFSFTNDLIIWDKLKLNKDQIMNYRKYNFISYGSCSFDEPRKDLTNLGIF